MRQKLSREEDRRAWLAAAMIVLLMALCGLGVKALSESRGERAYVPRDSEHALAASLGLDAIDVAVNFDPASAVQLHAVQTLTLTNRTGQAQDAIVLRSYTGAYLSMDTSPCASDELFKKCYGTVFSPGGLIVDAAAVDGAAVTPEWLDPEAHTVLALSTPWQPGETRTVTLTWHATVPEAADRFGAWDGVYALGALFPTPAMWLGDEWDTRPVVPVGDPAVAECANWTVTLTLPRQYIPAASAYAEPVLDGDTAVYRYEAPAQRDFTLTLSDRYVRAVGTEGDVEVIAYAFSERDARQMVKDASQALRCFAARWGALVYPTLTLCAVPFPYGGMEYTRLVMIGRDVVRAGGKTAEYTIAHEVAHQWWAIAVGSDAYAQPWQDETLCAYAVLDYVGQYSGASAREDRVQQTVDAAMRVTVPHTVTPGSPIDYFADLKEYSLVVYDRGCGLWLALEKLMGQDALDEALRDYYAANRFGLAARETLERVLSEHAGFDLSAFVTDYLDTLIVN